MSPSCGFLAEATNLGLCGFINEAIRPFGKGDETITLQRLINTVRQIKLKLVAHWTTQFLFFHEVLNDHSCRRKNKKR